MAWVKRPMGKSLQPDWDWFVDLCCKFEEAKIMGP